MRVLKGTIMKFNCKICNKIIKKMEGELCDNCWEVVSRLEDFCRSKKGREELIKILDKISLESGEKT